MMESALKLKLERLREMRRTAKRLGQPKNVAKFDTRIAAVQAALKQERKQ